MTFLLAVSSGQAACDSRGFSKEFGGLGLWVWYCGHASHACFCPTDQLFMSSIFFSATVAYRS